MRSDKGPHMKFQTGFFEKPYERRGVVWRVMALRCNLSATDNLKKVRLD